MNLANVKTAVTSSPGEVRKLSKRNVAAELDYSLMVTSYNAVAYIVLESNSVVVSIINT